MKTIYASILLLTTPMAYAQDIANASGTAISESSASGNNMIGWGLVILLFVQILIIRAMSQAIKSLSEADIFTNNRSSFSILLIAGLLLSSQVFGQSNISANDELIHFTGTDIYILVTLNILLSCVILWLYVQFKNLLKVSGLLKEEQRKDSAFWDIEHILTKSVPVEKEATIQFEHEYDGIRELDNVLPPWWLWMFYATIVFSFIYLIHYHISPIKAFENIGFIGPGIGQEALYQKEIEQAEKEKQQYLAQMADKVNEENVTALTDASDIAAGKEVFMTNCVTCHGKEAQGGAGPNLTDDYWLHGGGIKNIFKVIKYGVPEKGMISWESQLSPKQIQQVASYILTLKGTNPPGAKEPQGELWKEENTSSTPSDSTTQLKNTSAK